MIIFSDHISTLKTRLILYNISWFVSMVVVEWDPINDSNELFSLYSSTNLSIGIALRDSIVILLGTSISLFIGVFPVTQGRLKLIRGLGQTKRTGPFTIIFFVFLKNRTVSPNFIIHLKYIQMQAGDSPSIEIKKAPEHSSGCQTTY